MNEKFLSSDFKKLNHSLSVSLIDIWTAINFNMTTNLSIFQ